MQVIVQTPRTLVRQMTLDDFDDCYPWLSDPNVARYELYEPYTREGAHMEVMRMAGTRRVPTPGRWNDFAIVSRADNRVIGSVSVLYDLSDNRSFELGYRLAPAYQRQGLATEAIRPVVGLAFEWGAHRVFAAMDVRNTGSWRLAQRLGMTREAHLRENLWVKGAWIDEYIYAVLEHEYRPQG